jgi:hypothetical protein
VTSVERYRPPVLAGEEVCHVSGPLAHRHRLLAELAAMQRRGEISYAFNAVEDRAAKTFSVSYVKLREPRSRTPLYITAFCAATGTLVGLGGMVYHARHVFAAAAELALGAVGLAALVWLVTTIVRAAGSAGHCPGAWHR